MKPIFEHAHAETMNDFMALVRGWKIVVSYVYQGPDDEDLAFDLPDPEPGERYLAFNLARHGVAACERFRDVSMLERRMGDPSPRPLPYWSSFVVGMGPYSHAYSISEASRMVTKAREEMRMLWRSFGQ